MKILIPTVDFPPIEGGISTLTLEMARALTELGHEVSVVAPRSGEKGQTLPDINAWDNKQPFHVIRFGGYWLRWGRILPLFAKTWPLVKETDLIMAINVSYGGLLGLRAKRTHKKPYLAFAYAYEFLKFSNTPLIGKLLRAVYANAQSVIAISTYTADNLEKFGVDESQITRVLPGAPRALTVSEEDKRRVRAKFHIGDKPFILAVGRFVPRKGHMTLLNALPGVIAEHPDTALVLVGRGPLYEECRDRHKGMHFITPPEKEINSPIQIHFTGYVDDQTLAALYADCTLFALPTGEDQSGHVEGFGLVFVEANAYGKPVVAGRSGGVVDAVLEGETGLLVDPEDPTQLAEAINTLLSNPKYAAQLGDQGRRRVTEELNWKTFAKRVMETLS
jgi:phosphatidylinositol alpha-1,6-mannosyltransferase